LLRPVKVKEKKEQKKIEWNFIPCSVVNPPRKLNVKKVPKSEGN